LLDLFPQKGKFQRIGNAFMHSYPFLFIYKGVYGNIRDKVIQARGQIRALRLWSAGSFGQGPIRSHK